MYLFLPYISYAQIYISYTHIYISYTHIYISYSQFTNSNARFILSFVCALYTFFRMPSSLCRMRAWLFCMLRCLSCAHTHIFMVEMFYCVACVYSNLLAVCSPPANLTEPPRDTISS